MLQALRNKQREDGFTLIELMVVVLIIAILIAIAVPTFLGARERAQDKAAQSDLRNALTAAKVLYTDSQDYSDSTAISVSTLEGVEPSIDFVGGVTATEVTGPGMVGFNAESADVIVLVAESETGSFFCIADNVASSGGTTFGSDTGSSAAITNANTLANCGDASW